MNDQRDRAVDGVSELGEGEQQNDLHAKDDVNQEDDIAPDRSSRQVHYEFYDEAGLVLGFFEGI